MFLLFAGLPSLYSVDSGGHVHGRKRKYHQGVHKTKRNTSLVTYLMTSTIADRSLAGAYVNLSIPELPKKKCLQHRACDTS